jgi:hypothetical protein
VPFATRYAMSDAFILILRLRQVKGKEVKLSLYFN